MESEVQRSEHVQGAPSQQSEGHGGLTSIEQRLRLHASGYVAHYPWEWAEDAAPLLEEAAAEIERLRAVTEPMPACAASIGSVTPVEPRPLGDPEIAVEILRLRVAELEEAIRRLAEQDATLSLLCKRDGSQAVTVTMDATLTDAERSLIRRLAAACEGGHPREWTNRALTADDRATLRGLLERTK